MIRHYMNSLKYIKQCSSLEILNLNFINNDFDGNPFSKLKERTCTVKVIRACFYPFFYIYNEHVYQEYSLTLSI